MLRSKQFKDIAAALTFVNENQTINPLHFVPVTTTFPDGILLIYTVNGADLIEQTVKLFGLITEAQAKTLLADIKDVFYDVPENGLISDEVLYRMGKIRQQLISIKLL